MSKKSTKEKMISKSYSMPPSLVKAVTAAAIAMSAKEGRRVSDSEFVQNAIMQALGLDTPPEPKE